VVRFAGASTWRGLERALHRVEVIVIFTAQQTAKSQAKAPTATPSPFTTIINRDTSLSDPRSLALHTEVT